MVWSDSAGVSIVLPSDHVEGDGRNYIVVGEDIPKAISDQFTAAIIFHNGQYTGPDLPAGSGIDTTGAVAGIYPNGFLYWAIGITSSGALEIVSFYLVVPSPMAEAYVTYRRTVISIAAPIGADNPPVLGLGRGSYMEGALNANGVLATVVPGDGSGLTFGPRFSFWSPSGGFEKITFRLMADGSVSFSGLVMNISGVSSVNNDIILIGLPVWATPVAPIVFKCPATLSASTPGHVRVDITPNGHVYMPESTIPNGQWVGLNGRYYPGNAYS